MPIRSFLVSIVFAFTFFSGCNNGKNLQRSVHRYYFSVHPAAFSPESWKISQSVSIALELTDKNFSYVRQDDAKPKISDRPVKITAAGGIASTIVFEVSIDQADGLTSSDVEKTIYQALVAFSERIGDLEEFTRAKDALTGETFMHYPDLAGKKFLFHKITDQLGQATLETEHTQFFEGTLPDYVGKPVFNRNLSYRTDSQGNEPR